jgi:hypothetical protein
MVSAPYTLQDENIEMGAEISPKHCIAEIARRRDMQSADSGFKICSWCSLLVSNSWDLTLHVENFSYRTD